MIFANLLISEERVAHSEEKCRSQTILKNGICRCQRKIRLENIEIRTLMHLLHH